MTNTFAELARLLESGTPGPWFAGPMTVDDEGLTQCCSVGPFDVVEKFGGKRAHHCEDTICEVWDGNHPAEANAALIAAIRNAAPRLLAIAEAAREHISECEVGSQRASTTFAKLRALLTEESRP